GIAFSAICRANIRVLVVIEENAIRGILRFVGAACRVRKRPACIPDVSKPWLARNIGRMAGAHQHLFERSWRLYARAELRRPRVPKRILFYVRKEFHDPARTASIIEREFL